MSSEISTDKKAIEFRSLLENLINGFVESEDDRAMVACLLLAEASRRKVTFEATNSASLEKTSDSEANSILQNTTLTIKFKDVFDSPGSVDVMRERYGQIAREGFDSQHDDNYQELPSPLLLAGMAYLEHAMYLSGAEQDNYKNSPAPGYWPFKEEFWKPKNTKRDLVRAGAFIVAAVDAIERKEK